MQRRPFLARRFETNMMLIFGDFDFELSMGEFIGIVCMTSLRHVSSWSSKKKEENGTQYVYFFLLFRVS